MPLPRHLIYESLTISLSFLCRSFAGDGKNDLRVKGMNFIGAIILTTLIAELAINTVAEALNLRIQSNDLPDDFKDTYAPERHRRSQDYLETRTKFGWAAAACDLGLLLLFWFAGGFEWLDLTVRQWGQGPVVTGTLYIGSLMLLKSVFDLPFAVYSTFVIEQRFGFNTATAATLSPIRVRPGTGHGYRRPRPGRRAVFLSTRVPMPGGFAGGRTFSFWTAIYCTDLDHAPFQPVRTTGRGGTQKAIMDLAGAVKYPLQTSWSWTAPGAPASPMPFLRGLVKTNGSRFSIPLSSGTPPRRWSRCWPMKSAITSVTISDR